MAEFIFKILEKIIEELVKDPSATEKNLNLIRDQILATPAGRLAVVIVTALLCVACLVGLLKVVQWSAETLTAFWEKVLKPWLQTPEEKKRSLDYGLFADHVVDQMRALNQLEDWRDFRYAELEAELEAEGGQSRGWGFHRAANGLRREQSLSRALGNSSERLILLEGDPGSGKSVALRHLTEAMARTAAKPRSGKAVIPLYVNLKKLDRPPDRAVDAKLIEEFVRQTLGCGNNRNVDAFLDAEFGRGMREGRWLFLFDSFDEAPEILSSTEHDDTVRLYAEAIRGFLGSLNVCRGVIASRHFRGPRQLRWPKFRILPLSERRQTELVRKANLEPVLQEQLLGRLTGQFEQAARSPMLLGILVDYVHRRREFPANIHSILGNYLDDRLRDDETKLARKFNLTVGEVRGVAEMVAFTMTADGQVGLSLSRKRLFAALERTRFALPPCVGAILDALEFIRLAQADINISSDDRPFTFAHRRFQEFFATSMVLRSPGLVSAEVLATNGRWRETAAVMLQTQPPEACAPLLSEVRRLVCVAASSLPEQELDTEVAQIIPQPFQWRTGLLHALGLLQEGFVRRPAEIPQDLQSAAGHILACAYREGALWDKKWVVEVAAVADPRTLLWLIRQAVGSGSRLLRDAAYRQAARLSDVPDDVVRFMLQATAAAAARHPNYRDRTATYAHLARLDRGLGLMPAARLLFSIPAVDAVLNMLLVTLVFSSLPPIRLAAAVFLLGLVVYAATPLAYEFAALSSNLAPGRLRTGSPAPRASSKLMQRRIPRIRFSVSVPLMIELYVRLMVYLGVLGVLVAPGRHTFPTLLLFSAFAAYTFLWAPMARAAGSRAFMTAPYCWPLLPVWPVFYLIRNPGRVVSAAAGWARSNWLACLIWIPSLALLGYLEFWAIDRFGSALERLVTVPALTSAAIFFIGGVRVVLRDASRLRGRPTDLTGFLDRFDSFETPYFACRFLRYVRAGGLIPPGTASVDAIEAVAILGQTLQLRPDEQVIREAVERLTHRSGPGEFAAWYASREERPFGKHWYDHDTLDELYLLIQSMREGMPSQMPAGSGR